MTIAFNIEIWLIEACRSLATTPNSSSFASILEKKISLNNFFFSNFCSFNLSLFLVVCKHAFELYLEWRWCWRDPLERNPCNVGLGSCNCFYLCDPVNGKDKRRKKRVYSMTHCKGFWKLIQWFFNSLETFEEEKKKSGTWSIVSVLYHVCWLSMR